MSCLPYPGLAQGRRERVRERESERERMKSARGESGCKEARVGNGREAKARGGQWGDQLW